MNRRRWIALASAAALMGGPVTALAQAPQPLAQEKAQTFAQANGTQAGTIQNSSGGTVNVDPYNKGSDVKAFELPSNAPVFQGNGKVSSAALMKGVPVRIHYKNATAEGQKPQAIAVEVLNKNDATAARQQAESAPPLMMAQVGPSKTSSSPTASAPIRKLDNAMRNQKEQIFATASGSQPGKVAKLEGDKFILDPYQKAAGEAELRLDSNAPIYQGEGRVSASALAPGTDVRVYYRNEPAGQRPKIVAVEILNPDQAKQLEKSERDVPKSK